MYFILKGKGWPSKDYKRSAESKKSFHMAVTQKAVEETEARKEATAHQKMLREDHAESYNAKGDRKLVDFRETPNAKEIIKIGNEVKAMKRGGVDRERIDRELNPEVAKYTRFK